MPYNICIILKLKKTVVEVKTFQIRFLTDLLIKIIQ